LTTWTPKPFPSLVGPFVLVALFFPGLFFAYTFCFFFFFWEPPGPLDWQFFFFTVVFRFFFFLEYSPNPPRVEKLFFFLKKVSKPTQFPQKTQKTFTPVHLVPGLEKPPQTWGVFGGWFPLNPQLGFLTWGAFPIQSFFFVFVGMGFGWGTPPQFLGFFVQLVEGLGETPHNLSRAKLPPSTPLGWVAGSHRGEKGGGVGWGGLFFLLKFVWWGGGPVGVAVLGGGLGGVVLCPHPKKPPPPWN